MTAGGSRGPGQLRVFTHDPFVIAVEELENGARYVVGVRGGPQDPLPDLRIALASGRAERCASWEEAIQRSHIALGILIAGGANVPIMHKGTTHAPARPYFAVAGAFQLRSALGELAEGEEQTLERLADAVHFLAACAAAATRSRRHRAPLWRVLEELAHAGRRLNVDGALPLVVVKSARDELLNLREVPPLLVDETRSVVALLQRLLTTHQPKD